MKRETYRVALQPDGRTVFVLQGTTLVEAAGQAGIILNQPCGGEGVCGKCLVEVLGRVPPPTPADAQHISPELLADGWRLACRLVVASDLHVSIPHETRFFEQVILAEGKEHQYPFRPSVSKAFVSVPAATVDDQRSDLDRLLAMLDGGHLSADLPLVRALPDILTRSQGRVTAVVEGDQVQWVEPGDTTARLWGMAFDLGTTSLVGSLANLTAPRSGCEAVATRTNPQVHFGDDVVSRIAYVEKNADGLDKLQRRLVAALNEIVLEVCETAGVEPESIYDVTAVGNTTMTHIFLGINPASLAHAPYVGIVRTAVDVKARDVGLEVSPHANLHVLPNIAGFVGSDTVGVILASGMAREEHVQFAVDIGTNGEVVLGNRDRLVACSCAAGPAFEGARIRFGMRATEGAVSKVVVNQGIEVSVIGGGRPTGICGSGLIDAVAELLDAGVIDDTGRIVSPDAATRAPERLRRAIVEFEGQPAVALVDAASSKTGQPVLLTQRDVREVQLAKAAIRAGIEVLAREFGIEPLEAFRLLLAGGFGNFIRRSHAKRIGMLPPVPTERIEFIGNAAATGAEAALACRDCRQEAERISRRTEYVELASHPDFHAYFMDAIPFPPPT